MREGTGSMDQLLHTLSAEQDTSHIVWAVNSHSYQIPHGQQEGITPATLLQTQQFTFMIQHKEKLCYLY